MTQKQILAALRDYAYDLGAVVSIRKNLREQYEGRVRLNGARDYFVTYAGGTFALVHNVLHSHLERLQELQYAEGVKRGREYEAQLQTAVEQARLSWRSSDAASGAKRTPSACPRPRRARTHST